MIPLNIMRLLVMVSLISLIACKQQTPQNKKSTLNKDIPSENSPVPSANKTIYFSYDDGLTWKNNSEGLPSTTTVDLGGLAASEDKLALISKDSGLYYFNNPDETWTHISTDKPLLEANVGPLLFHDDFLYVGTKKNGVYYSKDDGQNWETLNVGLDNLTIRKLAEIDNQLYAATNSGLYSYNDSLAEWELEFGNKTLQVNGITTLDGDIYIGTSQGAFTSPIGKKEWQKIFSNGALHNISSDDHFLYAMVYNELYSSNDQGQTWQNIQSGLPDQLYTFNVVRVNNTLLAGQWNGVYRKDEKMNHWNLSSKGLPENLAMTNMQVFNNIIVVSGNERGLREGMTAD